MASDRSNGKAVSRSAGTRSAPRVSKAPCFTVMVSLAGMEAARSSVRNGSRGEKYAGMKAQARQARDEIVAWLRDQEMTGEFKRVSDVTAFGTFTVQVTPDVLRLLRRAPGVESVLRVGDSPMKLLSAR